MKKWITLAILVGSLVIGFAEQPTNLQAQSPTLYELTVEDLELDLDCQPICWSNFVPMDTTIDQIFAWFGPNSVVYKGDIYAPESYVGLNSGAFSLAAYSDNTQPTPFLRAYLVGVRIQGDNNPLMGDDVFKLTSSEAQRWLFATTISQYGLPSQLGFEATTYGQTGSHYTITLDYDNLNALFIYQGALTDRDLNPKICPDTNIGGMQLWMYSDQEADGLTMRRDLERYEHYSILFHKSTMPELQVLTDQNQIKRLVEEFEKTDCILVDSLPTAPN